MELETTEINKVIPHRFPFFLIDRVVDLEPKKKLVAIKNVSINEHFFVGHFDQEKIMPGVLIIEAMAQAASVFFYYSNNFQGKDLIYYLGKVSAKFLTPVVPGDQLRIEITSIKLTSKTGFLKAESFVGDKLVAEAELGLSAKEV